MARNNRFGHPEPGDIELGVSEVLKRHVTRHVHEDEPVSQRRLDFENARPRLLREMAAEATGVFFYGEDSMTSWNLRIKDTDSSQCIRALQQLLLSSLNMRSPSLDRC